MTLMVVGFAVWVIGGAIYLGNVTGFFPTIPYAGFVTISVGAFAAAIGLSLCRGEPVLGEIEKRRTSLIILIPALVLFGIMLGGAAMLIGANFEQETSGGRWLASGIFLATSFFIFSSLVRELVLRFGPRTDQSGAGPRS